MKFKSSDIKWKKHLLRSEYLSKNRIPQWKLNGIRLADTIGSTAKVKKWIQIDDKIRRYIFKFERQKKLFLLPEIMKRHNIYYKLHNKPKGR